jgi:response regulator RpfG family c-di-GMP phosphodiesterase
MDMRMPVMDGYEATRRIKATTRGQATVILALTASALEEDRAVILSEGCDDYLRKPFREDELLDALSRHLGIVFEYEELAPLPSPDAAVSRETLAAQLALTPSEWREQLRQATVLGYASQIQALVSDIEGENPELARTLSRKAAAFEHKAILDALDDVSSEGPA